MIIYIYDYIYIYIHNYIYIHIYIYIYNTSRFSKRSKGARVSLAHMINQSSSDSSSRPWHLWSPWLDLLP